MDSCHLFCLRMVIVYFVVLGSVGGCGGSWVVNSVQRYTTIEPLHQLTPLR